MMQLKLREDEIGRKLEEAHRTGELASAPSFGKPLAQDCGWDQAPEELRLGFKILKDAGFTPPEVHLFKKRAQLRAELAVQQDPTKNVQLRQELSNLEQLLALRLEALRKGTGL